MLLFRKLILSLFLVLLVACAPKQEARKRYFWPPLVDNPKIEFIGVLQSDHDVKGGKVGAFEEAFFGREKPQALFLEPFDVYANDQNQVFVTEPKRKYVLKIDLALGTLGRMLDTDGKAYPFKMPTGVSGDNEGRVYVVDSSENQILVFGPDNRLYNKLRNKGFGRIVGLTVDEGRGVAYVVDAEKHEIVCIDLAEGNVVLRIGSRGGHDGELNFPLDIDLDKDGNLYVLDSMNARVQAFTPSGEFIRAFGERGTAVGSFRLPKGLAVSAQGQVYITDSMAHRVVVFSTDGQYLLTLGGQVHAGMGGVKPGGFLLPAGADVSTDGSIWVVDSLNRMLHRYQFLTSEYLETDPILPGQAVNPFVESGN